MLPSTLYCIVMAAFATVASAAPGGRKAFAHYMLGLTNGFQPSDWNTEINKAKAVGIDGFALNAGPNDFWTDTQLGQAYAAAENLGFSMFVSFDQACCDPNWDVSHIVNVVNRFKDSPAQFKVNGKPFVSTFEGTDFISNWAAVRQQTGGIYLVPDWTSLGPQGVQQHLSQIDGAFSWNAWPQGDAPKNLDEDNAYRSILGGKPYMMGVSPWFYSTVFGKNWMFHSDTLWFDRWQQAIDFGADWIEIITWNDYGESHYISDVLHPGEIVQGAEVYVNGFKHDAILKTLPWVISSYKAGSRQPITQEGATFWYRTTPKNICSDGGTTCGPNSGIPAAQCADDSIFVFVMSQSATTITVSIGGSTTQVQSQGGARILTVPLNGRTGSVVVSFNGKSGTGPLPITNSCPSSGRVNFNAVFGGAW